MELFQLARGDPLNILRQFARELAAENLFGFLALKRFDRSESITLFVNNAKRYGRDVDFAMQIATKDIPDLRKASGLKVISYPSARGWWLGMTWRKEPFNNSHFRRAIPYDTLLQVVTRGLAQRLRSCVAMNMSGDMEEFWLYETNLERARDELARAQVPDGFAVTVPVSAGDAFDEESRLLESSRSGKS
jgi:hypothetical protein